MKTETAVARILESDKPTSLKILKLQTLALRTFPSSPAQKKVIATYEELQAKERLEYLRRELRAERVSYGELNELQALAEHIPADDVELREAAGLPENR